MGKFCINQDYAGPKSETEMTAAQFEHFKEDIRLMQSTACPRWARRSLSKRRAWLYKRIQILQIFRRQVRDRLHIAATLSNKIEDLMEIYVELDT